MTNIEYKLMVPHSHHSTEIRFRELSLLLFIREFPGPAYGPGFNYHVPGLRSFT
jgi:hypothetical protein